MFGLRDSVRALGLTLGCVLLVSACQEDVTGGAACPALCPDQNVVLKDTTIFPVSEDSTLIGFPPLGTEGELLVARRGDSLVTAAVMRYDTLSPIFPKPAGDTTTRRIVAIDSAFLNVTLAATTQLATAPVTFEVYDVDAPGVADPDTAAVRQLLRPDRLLATKTVRQDSLTGSVRIELPRAFVQARILGGLRLRFGLLIRSAATAEVRLVQGEAGVSGPQLIYLARSDRDTPQVRDTLRISSFEISRSPVPDLEDYTIALIGTPPTPPAVLAVGGLPAKRVFLRFVIPSQIIDSTTIVRASLILTQLPNRGVIGSNDTINVSPRIVIASNLVDPGRSALLANDPFSFGVVIDPIRTTPSDSGQHRLDIPSLLRIWRGVDETINQRSLVLVSSEEASDPAEVRFFSIEAPAGLQPRLRITYIPRVGLGLP
ncbi:MAG TPA: hypothetical protein VJ672_11675 [Gemmatimonadaceae bacterium]|nr:hypothetical protein [Gemmatimonadaceae bacterium]